MLSDLSFADMQTDWRKREQFIPLTKIHLSEMDDGKLRKNLVPQLERQLEKARDGEVLCAIVRLDDGEERIIKLHYLSLGKVAELILESESAKSTVLLGTVPRKCSMM